MIGHKILSAFADMLDDPAGVLSRDAMNPDYNRWPDDDLNEPTRAFLSDDALPNPDTGCIIAVVDDAIPFVHQRFTLPGNISRVASVWLQDAKFRAGNANDLPSGAEWRGAELSDLLARTARREIPDEDAIYRMTGAVDFSRPVTPSGAFETGHGAAVAPLAAGFDVADPQARCHPLIAVCLPPRIIADSMGVLAPVPILAAVCFIIKRARRLCRFVESRTGRSRGTVRLPVVINLSLGLTAGPRDGASLLEQFLDAVSARGLSDLGPVHVILPMGNHRQGRLRARLSPGQSVGWQLPPDDPTINAIEIWGMPYSHEPRGDLRIALSVPGLAAATTAFDAPGQHCILRGPDGTPLARAYYTPHQLRNGDWRDGIILIATPTCPEHSGEPFAPPGQWRIEIAADAPEGVYDLSAQRDEVIRGFRRGARQSWFDDPAYQNLDPAGFPILADNPPEGGTGILRAGTVNTYATGERTVRTGAAYQQGQGMTRYGALLENGQQGDCLVPVDRSARHVGMILRGRNSGSFTVASGTSMAAPQVARWLAIQLSQGQRPADRAAIRKLVQVAFPGSEDTPILQNSLRFHEF